MCITECFTSLYLSSSLVKNPKRQKQTNKPQKKPKQKKTTPNQQIIILKKNQNKQMNKQSPHMQTYNYIYVPFKQQHEKGLFYKITLCMITIFKNDKLQSVW